MNTVRYIFFWGRCVPLSKLEAQSLLPHVQFSDLSTDSSICSEISLSEIEAFAAKAGGVVKIAIVRDETGDVDAKKLAEILMNETSEGKRIVFAINSEGKNFIVTSEFLESIKHILTDKGVSSRYLQTKGGSTSAVAIDKERATELSIVESTTGFIIGKTIFSQEYEAWNRREYGRPYSDAKRGMLPIKVARMVVNIALRGVPPQSKPLETRRLLLDPFCGMGSILGEALVGGWNVVGSDISEEVLVRSQKNIEWLVKESDIPAGRFIFFLSDATHVSKHLEPDSIDAIVTEPYMGSTDIGEGSISVEKAKNIAKGLGKLYTGCLRDWHSLLKPNGIVVLAIPKFYISDREIYVKNVVDRCEMLGYTTKAGPIEYSRPQAKVRREFYIFEKK
ncbi:MAG: hypothetical protein AAB508_04365 [Patescibacteria group bacterium]